MNLLLVFLTGLTTGGVSCAALQSGLLISALSGSKKQPALSCTDSRLQVSMFLLAKLLAYTILGFLLGTFATILNLSLSVRVALQLLSIVYMFATAMNLLDVHPLFRYVVITPPKFIWRHLKDTSKAHSYFSPMLLGAMTILIPCGVTQAMEVVALSTGNGLRGALIMAFFVLGTIPMFTLIGMATSKLTGTANGRYLKFAAALLIVMSLYTLNGTLTVLDAPFSVGKVIAMTKKLQQYETGKVAGTAAVVTGGVQKIAITVDNHGYAPRFIQVQHGIPVELTVTTNNVYSCATAFTLRAFHISKQLAPTDSQVFTFTPDKPGQYTYSCSMGMYTGTLEVI